MIMEVIPGGWKCTHCGAIIDQILRENHWMKEDHSTKK